MKFLLYELNSTGREFDNIQELLDAIADLAQAYEENGEKMFAVGINMD